MFKKIPGLVMKSKTIRHIGGIENIVSVSMEALDGHSNIGDIVSIYNEKQNRQIPTEVVGFKDGRVQLITYEAIGDIASGNFVRNTRRHLEMPVGDFLKGRVINTMRGSIGGWNIFHASQHYTINSPYANPPGRLPIRGHLGSGTKATGGLNAIGEGQRIRILTGSGVGEGTLMGIIAENVRADIDVIALVGKYDREALEFVQRDLGEEGMKCSILVVATSNQPTMLRTKYPLVTTTTTECFRDQGFDVLLMMDSLTRYAMAQGKIGLAIGEPPITRGYTPSTYTEFSKLLERSGNFNQDFVTGAYTVLVEGGDTSGPVADTVRGILDGRIILSRQLTNENYFLVTDIGASISRLIVGIADEGHRRTSSCFCDILGFYQRNSDLISIGAYKKGVNAALDEAVSKINKMNAFLQQGIDERFSYGETLSFVESIVG